MFNGIFYKIPEKHLFIQVCHNFPNPKNQMYKNQQQTISLQANTLQFLILTYTMPFCQQFFHFFFSKNPVKNSITDVHFQKILLLFSENFYSQNNTQKF